MIQGIILVVSKYHKIKIKLQPISSGGIYTYVSTLYQKIVLSEIFLSLCVLCPAKTSQYNAKASSPETDDKKT